MYKILFKLFLCSNQQKFRFDDLVHFKCDIQYLVYKERKCVLYSVTRKFFGGAKDLFMLKHIIDGILVEFEKWSLFFPKYFVIRLIKLKLLILNIFQTILNIIVKKTQHK